MSVLHGYLPRLQRLSFLTNQRLPSDPISAGKIEETLYNLKDQYTLLLVTRSMQQASRISQRTAFSSMENSLSNSSTKDMFLNPQHKETEDYITGKFG